MPVGRNLVRLICGVVAMAFLLPCASAKSKRVFPYYASEVVMPVSLALGSIRTPEFTTITGSYDFIIEVEKPLPFMQMTCMMGVTTSPLDLKDCRPQDPLLRADWVVKDGEAIVAKGSIPDLCACAFTDKHIYKLLGRFEAEGGQKYTVEIRFTKDGSVLDVAHPILLIIQHKRFW